LLRALQDAVAGILGNEPTQEPLRTLTPGELPMLAILPHLTSPDGESQKMPECTGLVDFLFKKPAFKAELERSFRVMSPIDVVGGRPPGLDLPATGTLSKEYLRALGVDYGLSVKYQKEGDQKQLVLTMTSAWTGQSGVGSLVCAWRARPDVLTQWDQVVKFNESVSMTLQDKYVSESALTASEAGNNMLAFALIETFEKYHAKRGTAELRPLVVDIEALDLSEGTPQFAMDVISTHYGSQSDARTGAIQAARKSKRLPASGLTRSRLIELPLYASDLKLRDEEYLAALVLELSGAELTVKLHTVQNTEETKTLGEVSTKSKSPNRRWLTNESGVVDDAVVNRYLASSFRRMLLDLDAADWKTVRDALDESETSLDVALLQASATEEFYRAATGFAVKLFQERERIASETARPDEALRDPRFGVTLLVAGQKRAFNTWTEASAVLDDALASTSSSAVLQHARRCGEELRPILTRWGVPLRPQFFLFVAGERASQDVRDTRQLDKPRDIEPPYLVPPSTIRLVPRIEGSLGTYRLVLEFVQYGEESAAVLARAEQPIARAMQPHIKARFDGDGTTLVATLNSHLKQD
jgi:hypothetical protein